MNYKQLTKKTYDEIADDYSKRDFSNIEETSGVKDDLDKFTSLLPKGSKALDVGCGSGRDSRYLYKNGLKVTGIDFSSEMIRNAKEHNPEIEYIQMDLEHLDFPEKTFDGVWANASLHHIPKANLKAVLSDIYKMLKVNGIFAVKVKHGSFEGIKETERFNKKFSRHFSFYLPEEFIKISESVGFSIIEQSITNSGEWLNVVAKK